MGFTSRDALTMSYACHFDHDGNCQTHALGELADVGRCVDSLIEELTDLDAAWFTSQIVALHESRRATGEI